jgi:hypothetical protein
MCYNFALDRLEYSAHSHESPRTLYSDKSFVYDPSCSQTLRRKVYVRKSFCIVRLHTLSFSVSRKSLICRSYENSRGVYQLFPFWNSRKVWPCEFCRFLITHLSNSLPLTLFRSAHPVKDAHPSRVRCGGRGILLRCSFPCYNFHYLLCVYALAHSFALFCTHAKLNPFLFMRFRTLCEKRPGGVGGTLHLLP